MPTGIFLDTNLLIYSLDPADPGKRATAVDVLRHAIIAERLVVSPQTINECYRVLTDRRAIMPRDDARRFLRPLLAWCTAQADAASAVRAWEIQDQTGFAWWDCLMLASAARAGCGSFLTEDMEHGRIVQGVRITNPFRDDTDLEAILN